MNYGLLIGCLLFCFSCNSQDSETLKYTFKLSENKDEIHVNLLYKSLSPTDTVDFLIPSSYDRFQMKNTITINDVQLQSQGEMIKTEEDIYQVISDKNSIHLSYTIPSLSDDTTQISCKGDEHFIPHINKQFFHFFGDKGLVVPNFEIQEQRSFDVELIWQNFPQNWHIANDFGIVGENKSQSKQKMVLNTIGNTLFFGGEYRKEAHHYPRILHPSSDNHFHIEQISQSSISPNVSDCFPDDRVYQECVFLGL